MLSLQSDPRQYKQQLMLQVPRVSYGTEDAFTYRMAAVESGGSSSGSLQFAQLLDQQRAYHSHEGFFYCECFFFLSFYRVLNDLIKLCVLQFWDLLLFRSYCN